MGIGTGIRRGVFGLITREKSIGFSTPPLHLAPVALLRGNVCALILVQLKPLRVPLLKRRPNHPPATRRPTPRPTLRPTLPLQIPLPPRPPRPQARVPQRRRPAPLARPLLRRPAILLPRPLPASLQLPLPPRPLRPQARVPRLRLLQMLQPTLQPTLRLVVPVRTTLYVLPGKNVREATRWRKKCR